MCCVNMKAIWRLDPWLCGLEFLTFIWIEYNFLGWGLWFRPFLSNHNNFLLHFPHLNNESFALFWKMFVVTAEKSEKKAPEKGILLVANSAQSFFPTTFLSGIFSLFNEKFEPFWKKRPGQTTSGGHSDFSFEIFSITY